MNDNRRMGITMTNKLNPCELEIDLFCKGVQIDNSCTLEQDGRLFSRTRAGLGSGLELVIPGDLKDIWMNVPVEEEFVKNTPYHLIKDNSAYYLIDKSKNNAVYSVMIPSNPGWYFKKTSGGTPMTKIGVLQGTYLGIYIGEACKFWKYPEKLQCKFCTSGINVGTNEMEEKEVDDVVEVARTAKEESGTTFVHFNSGYQGDCSLDIAAPYVKAIKEKVGMLVGVQLIPTDKLSKYDMLIDLGANHFSFCYEFHNPEYFSKYLPGKEKLVGQNTFFKALEYTTQKLGKGRCSGEIIAGIEPMEDTLKAIDFITDIGAFPTICIFRPLVGAGMEMYSSPNYGDMRKVMKYMYEACMKKGLPIGLAPNIEVSLVVQPDDAKYLVPRNLKFKSYQMKLKTLKALATPIFRKELRPKTLKSVSPILITK